MRCSVLARVALVVLALSSLVAAPLQAAPLIGAPIEGEASSIVRVKTGLEAGKFCSVIRSCNFSRKAAVRGCLSSYSCRQCDFVKRCSGGRCEWRSRCGWGSAGS